MLSILDDMVSEPRLERMLGFMRDRPSIAAETSKRVVSERLATVKDRGGLELVLNDVCYHEWQRLRSTKAIDKNDRELHAIVGGLRKGLRRLSESELKDALGKLVDLYVSDIIGNFNAAIFTLTSRVIPVGLSMLFAPFRLGRSMTDAGQLRERVLVEGQTADLERLSRRGTLVVVPTHLSNLDSIVIGFGLERARLPPVTYGAGKNLWANPILGFFMRHLGAYRVDRRIKAELYKETLKAYSTVLLERGYHSLFFPGGTRSRSGAVEEHLKLGLAGTAIRATVNLMSRPAEKSNRPIYFVPATINYHLVLEAATLIEDFLKDAGKSRYIIDDDESTQVARVARYLKDTLTGESSMTIQFGEPLDVLGHRVGHEGESYDDRGRAVELRPFFTVNGEVKADGARDAEYTRELGERIAESFKKDTHVLSTHLVGYVLHRLLVKAAPPRADLFHVLRGQQSAPLPIAEVLGAIDRAKAHLSKLAQKRGVRIGARVASNDAPTILDEALRYFALFHEEPTARREGEAIEVLDRTLTYYYHNRLTAYGLEEVV